MELFREDPIGPLYVVTEKFGPSHPKWAGYIEWSGLKQVREIVSLDSMLCETVVDGPADDDWPHIVNENFMLHYFTDLPYLLKRAGSVSGRNLLCIFRNPSEPPAAPDGFRLLGYDLVDVLGSVSALVNCGGFPNDFSNEELSSFGLIDSFDRAYEIQRALREHYRGGEHSTCHVYAMFRKDDA